MADGDEAQDADFDEVFRARIARHVAAAREALKQDQKGVLAELAARGLLNSGARIKRQVAARDSRVRELIDWSLSELTAFQGGGPEGWRRFGNFTQKQLEGFLQSSRQEIRLDQFGSGAAKAGNSILDRTDEALAAALKEFQAGLWRLQRSPAVVMTNPTYNTVTAINSQISVLQQGGSGAQQHAEVEAGSLAEALESFAKAVADAQLSDTQRAQLMAEVDTIRPQLAKQEPNGNILRESFKTLRNVAEGIAAGLLTAQFQALWAVATTHLHL